jgi:hypothetical protein
MEIFLTQPDREVLDFSVLAAEQPRSRIRPYSGDTVHHRLTLDAVQTISVPETSEFKTPD